MRGLHDGQGGLLLLTANANLPKLLCVVYIFFLATHKTVKAIINDKKVFQIGPLFYGLNLLTQYQVPSENVKHSRGWVK